jgi:hypothetical protein
MARGRKKIIKGGETRDDAIDRKKLAEVKKKLR